MAPPTSKDYSEYVTLYTPGLSFSALIEVGGLDLFVLGVNHCNQWHLFTYDITMFVCFRSALPL
jgi:hypothetical protein